MKRFLCSFLLGILFCLPIFSQTLKKDSIKVDSVRRQVNLSGPSSNNYAPNYSPLTPNAASFQKHSDYQVNLATGVPDISIPLYTIEEGILKNPIVLRYHASGHTISEFASWVGWGFNLDYGGSSLNRSIIGMADDINSTGGYLYNPITNRNLCDNSADYTFCSVANAGNADLDPDLFSFSTHSSSGKFMLRHNNEKPFLMPWQAVEIIKEINTDGTIKAFEVDNPNGTVYHFGITTGGFGGTENQRILTSSGNFSSAGITTWQIGQITTLTNENKISFQYQTGGKVTQVSQSWGASMVFNNTGSPTATSVFPQSSLQTKDVEESNIAKIFFTNGEIEFVGSNVATEPRADIPESPKLKEIKVYAYQGSVKTLIKSITFHYSYFKDRTNADGRLKLDSLRMFGVAGTTPQVYRFDYTSNNYSWKYNTGTEDVGVDANKQDYFGYFNNKPNNHLIDIPSYNGVTILDGTADRSTNETYLKEGLLSKITYPEGGSTTFDFEANRYKNNSIEVLGGGLRVKSIKHFDGLGNQSSMKSYKYGSDAGDGVGKLNSIWSFPSSTRVGEYSFISGFDIHKSISIGSNGLAEMSSHDGTPVYYTSVREYNEVIANTTNNGYSDYTFSYEPDVIVNTPFGLVRDIEPWKRGLLLTKSVYKADNTLVQKNLNTYDAFKAESIVNMGKVWFLNQANKTCNTCSSGMYYGFLMSGGIVGNPNTPTGTPCANPQLVYFTGQNKTGQQKIIQTSERNYSGNSYVENVQNFTYDNYLQQSAITTLSSKGETLKTSFTHPYDYTVAPYTNMVAYNYLSPVIEETNFINNVQTFKKSTDYLGFNPFKIRTKIGAGTEITPITFNNYDTRGNLIIFTLRNGQTTFLTWYGTADGGKTDLLKSQTVGSGSTGSALQRTMTYDYVPLTGVKSITDYNGYTTNYGYDGFQRLLSIKDTQGFLLKDFYYHYANQSALTDLGVTPTNTLNYLISRTARVQQTGSKLTSQVDSTTTEIQYFDGLSKNIQSLVWKATPDKAKDLISQTNFYDGFARINKGLLPTPSDGNWGAYKSNAQALATAFYDTDTYPYNETVFEPSPLNRTDKQFGAGQAWRVAGNEKFTQQFYQTAGGDIYQFNILTNGNVQWVSSYDTSSLYSNLSVNERGFKTYELKDKQGRVTHKFQQLAMPFNYAITAYVYDEANGGRLAFVIPPETYNKFGSATDPTKKQGFSIGDSLYNEGVYHYAFDGIGNLVQKHIPGGGITRYVFDKYDRVVMENDSKDSTNLWKITKYDALGRKIMGGILTNLGAKTRQAIQTDFDNFGAVNTNFAYEESTNFGGLYNYTNHSFPTAYTVADADLKEVIYYDNYSQIDTTGYGFKSVKAFHPQGLTKGLFTGTLIRNVETNEWYKSVNFYDYKSRNIQTHTKNSVGGIDRMETQYRFNGDILKMRITHKKTNVVDLVELYEYSYDHLGRKLSFTHNSKVVAKYSYDNVSRLLAKKFSPAGTAQSSQKTGNWTDISTWLSGILPLSNDHVTINTGQIVTIPSGQIASAGILNDKGTLNNLGTLNFGKYNASDLYNQTFFYHIRGGLRGYNLDANYNLTNALFSYRIDYESGTDGLFDGNIAKQSWKSSIDNIQRDYTHTYDGGSRLLTSAYISTKTGENYSLNAVSYDLNGNIKTLSRSGATNTNYTAFGNVDNLTYTYQNYSNKLVKIADATTTNADLGDFRDGNTTGNDYEYWADGSLRRDRNKGIDSIKYNYLKLPNRIKFSNGKWVEYKYDASGKKIKKITSEGITTDYVGNLIYENNGGGQPLLNQISHDEGRIVNGVYEYNITDHNNDLRIAFKDSAGIATPTQSIFYDPWGLSMKGMAITRNPANFNKFQFLNRETQFEMGYIDLIHRQFDPQTGRFTSQDPVIEGQEHLSLYQYGWNNPIIKSDPNGLMPEGECCDNLPIPRSTSDATSIAQGTPVNLNTKFGGQATPAFGITVTFGKQASIEIGKVGVEANFGSKEVLSISEMGTTSPKNTTVQTSGFSLSYGAGSIGAEKKVTTTQESTILPTSTKGLSLKSVATVTTETSSSIGAGFSPVATNLEAKRTSTSYVLSNGVKTTPVQGGSNVTATVGASAMGKKDWKTFSLGFGVKVEIKIDLKQALENIKKYGF